jgi:acetyl-CoA carboxylase biotin carboxyl carrier protein
VDTEKIKQLVRLVEESAIAGLAVEEGDCKIEIRKSGAPAGAAADAPVPAPPPTAPRDTGSLTAIKAPMTGTFYAAAASHDRPLVAVGDTVAKGQPVCVIEAMKTFNEIEADVSGAIEKILAQNGQPVELGQPLFLVK